MIIITGLPAVAAAAIAEQISLVLARRCVIAAADEAALPPQAAAVISGAGTQKTYPCPVVDVSRPPVRMREVLAVLAGILRDRDADTRNLGGGYVWDERQKRLSHIKSSKETALTDKEARLLSALAEATGRAAAKEELLKTIWGFEDALDTHTLETHIYRLRGKFRDLSGDEDIIAAAEGGYVLKL